MGLNTTILINNLPDPRMDLADKIEVTEQMDQTTTYNIHYSIDICEGDISRLKEANLNPGVKMTVMVPEEFGLMNCLVKGPINSQQIQLLNGGAGSWMNVGGADVTLEMGREFKSKVWDNITDHLAVTTIVATDYQLIPDISLTSSVHTELGNVLVQRNNDLQFIRQLASRNGFHFWVDCNPLGLEVAHFKKPDLSGSPKVTLTLNQDDCNMSDLSINWDVERPTTVENQQINATTKNIVDNGSSNGLVTNDPREQSLRDIQGSDVRSTHLATAADDGNMASSDAIITESDWFINASCKTTFHKIKKVVHAFDVVEIVGVGSRHSGKYLVSGVKHTIDETAHTMEIDLIRNVWNA